MFRRRKPNPPHFAAANQIAGREALVNEFIREVLGLPWAFVSDGSSLNDFRGVLSDDELMDRIQDVYGVTLEPKHWEIPLWQLLDVLETNRQRLRHLPN